MSTLGKGFLFTFALAVTVLAQDVSPELYSKLEYRHIGPVGNRVIAVIAEGSPVKTIEFVDYLNNQKAVGFEVRLTILGHIQRGGSPSAFDRVLGTRLGAFAVDMIERGEFGHMASLQGNRIVSAKLSEATSRTKKVDQELYDIAATFFD